MGVFRVTLEIGDPLGDRYEAVQALVDTGASHTAAPASLLHRLGVVVHSRSPFELADGSVQDFDVGLTWVRVDGLSTITSVVFAPEGAEPVLGEQTLEGLLLRVDPVRRRLVPVPGLLKQTAVEAEMRCAPSPQAEVCGISAQGVRSPCP